MSTHQTTIDPTTPEGGTAPALNPPAWSGRKAAIGVLRSSGGQPASVHAVPAVVRKDFSAVPVCGSVRPLADQRARRRLAT